MEFIHNIKLSNYLLILIFTSLLCFSIYLILNIYIPDKIIPVTGMPIYQRIEVNTSMLLYTDEQVTILVPKTSRDNLTIQIKRIELKNLPIQLPDNKKFITAYDIKLFDGSNPIELFYDNKKLKMGFGVFANYLGTGNFISVLRYSDNNWVNISIDSRLKATTSKVGIFVLCIDE